MADMKTIFLGASCTDSEGTQLECFCNVANRIAITILDEKVDNYGYPVVIEITKETAIKFSKELRKQISLIEESEV